MARKGTATVKTANKDDKYIVVDSDSEEVSRGSSESLEIPLILTRDSSKDRKLHHVDKVDDAPPVTIKAAGEQPQPQLNSSKPAAKEPHQPRQASATATVGQSNLHSTLANSLFPPDADADANDDTDTKPVASIETPDPHLATSSQAPRRKKAAKKSRVRTKTVATPRPRVRTAAQVELPPHLKEPSAQPDYYPGKPTQEYPNMQSGGAYIPPNQQRNMRACMVCSIVRTQQQFLASGCPNCEYFLELSRNLEQINDCTSQVFDGLITLVDPKRSWVARYQRIDDYVPGVYATQVEGILPEDIIVAVENAGINYVPRDGSEQDMLPKD
jgi:transcription elongation factor SPT4